MTSWHRWIRQPQTTLLRKAIFQIHLWSGIGVGLYVLFVSVTGSVLVWRNELAAAATRDPITLTGSGSRLTDEQLKEVVTRAYRRLSLTVGISWIVFLGPVIVTTAALLVSPAKWRTIATSAALVAFVNIVVATAIFPLHGMADKHYQRTVVTGRFDEITARLGPNWEETYLAPVEQALLGTTTSEALPP